MLSCFCCQPSCHINAVLVLLSIQLPYQCCLVLTVNPAARSILSCYCCQPSCHINAILLLLSIQLPFQCCLVLAVNPADISTKVGKVPTFRASDTNTDLPIVSTDLFSEFQYLKNSFIASKWRFISDTIASSHKKIPFMLKYRFKASKSSVSTDTIACAG